jgi:beta-mannanase
MPSTSKDARYGKPVCCAVLAASVLLISSSAGSGPATSNSVGGAGFQFGAYDPYGTFSHDPKIGIEHVFIPWEDANLASLNAADQYANDRGRSLLITVEPWSWSRSAKSVDPSNLYAGMMAGRYDALIQVFCRTASALKSPTTIRWGHEMDLGNKRYPWSQWTPTQYITAYRHFVDVCRTEIGNDVKFMWSPRGEANLRDYYPGEGYVDTIGLSIFGFQKYEIDLYGNALSLAERLTPSYQLVAAYDKDIYITEFGCHGDEEYLIRCMNEAKSSAASFPKLAGVIYFNEVETYPWPGPYGHPDWRILSRLVAQVRR